MGVRQLSRGKIVLGNYLVPKSINVSQLIVSNIFNLVFAGKQDVAFFPEPVYLIQEKLHIVALDALISYIDRVPYFYYELRISF